MAPSLHGQYSGIDSEPPYIVGAAASNYEVVIAALKKRYEQPAAIKQALYRELERLPRAKESNLRTTIEAIDRIIKLLGFQGEDVNSTLIIYLIKQKLPKSTLEKIEYEKSEWTVPTLRDRLATFVIAEENVTSILGYASKEPYSPRWETMDMSKLTLATINTKHNRPPRKNEATLMHPPKTNRMCSFCTKPHRTHECRKFFTPEERSKRVTELKLCFLCLKEGHRSKDCKALQCFKCGRRHHPALCSPINTVTKNTPANQATIHIETNATFANIGT
uniref:CCHC-type domain-containing protein n=1 Tax=Wuchereria bancrofti TaxID=6293 RepID=A0A1I8EQA2_WUCBA